MLSIALLVRLPGLDTRPFHTDEAVNAFLLQELFDGTYAYRQHDHHGPSLYYLSAVLLGSHGLDTLAEFEPWRLRSVPLLASLVLVGSVLLFWRPFLGQVGSLAAGAGIALGAPFVYFGGIYIHELLLLLFLVLSLLGFWRLREQGGLGSVLLFGLSSGLALGTKETAAPLLLLLVLAGLPGSPQPVRKLLLNLLLAAGLSLGCVLLLYSDLGREPGRAFDLFRATGAQTSRGLGSEHAYPWWQYLKWSTTPNGLRLPWSGWLLPAGGLLGYWLRRDSALARTLLLWALLLFAFFSLLPYKTPWLMLAWLLPLSLLGGFAWERLWLASPRSTLVLGLAAAVLLLQETHRVCHRYPTADSNPLAYSPSSPDQERLKTELEALARQTPEGLATLVQVCAKDYWPLPWTLRHFPRTAYWTTADQIRPEGFLLLGPEQVAGSRLHESQLRPYELRPGIFLFLRLPSEARP